MTSHFKISNNESLAKIVETSYNISEAYPAMLELVFNQHNYNKSSVKIPCLNIIYEIYNVTECSRLHSNKMVIYRFFKRIREEKAYEIFENKETAKVLKTICKYHYAWINNIDNWSKKSRNPFKQIESLSTHLFCKHPLPKFLYNGIYSKYSMAFKWFLHLGEGKSAKDLPGLYCGWTKKMAHEFLNIKNEGIDVIDAVVISISKISGGDHRLFPYLYSIQKVREGIINPNIGKAEFWCHFIQYFSAQVMFDPDEISHIADYVDHIKYTPNQNGKSEKPNFDIRKKNIQTLMNEAQEWTRQLNQIAKQIGIARRNQNTDYVKQQVAILETNWASSKVAPKWEYIKKVNNVKVTFIMVELCSGKELLDEGRTMNHCVYSYVNSCKIGSCRIFSLREKQTYGSILTIEVRNNSMVQIRGKGNRRPSTEEIKILNSWATEANFSKIQS